MSAEVSELSQQFRLMQRKHLQSIYLLLIYVIFCILLIYLYLSFFIQSLYVINNNNIIIIMLYQNCKEEKHQQTAANQASLMSLKCTHAYAFTIIHFIIYIFICVNWICFTFIIFCYFIHFITLFFSFLSTLFSPYYLSSFFLFSLSSPSPSLSLSYIYFFISLFLYFFLSFFIYLFISSQGCTQAQEEAVAYNQQRVQERLSEIKKISQSINQLAQMFQEMHMMVVEQGTLLDRVDQNLLVARQQTQQAVQELTQVWEGEMD